MSRVLAVVLALIGVLVLSGTALAAPSGVTTVNLRTCVDLADDICQSEGGDLAVDGVVVCLQGPQLGTRCGATEDGEFWVDSLPHGPYRAWVEPHPDLRLEGVTCSTFPNVLYRPCKVRGAEVRFFVAKGLNAVNISFLLAPANP